MSFPRNLGEEEHRRHAGAWRVRARLSSHLSPTTVSTRPHSTPPRRDRGGCYWMVRWICGMWQLGSVLLRRPPVFGITVFEHSSLMHSTSRCAHIIQILLSMPVSITSSAREGEEPESTSSRPLHPHLHSLPPTLGSGQPRALTVVPRYALVYRELGCETYKPSGYCMDIEHTSHLGVR